MSAFSKFKSFPEFIDNKKVEGGKRQHSKAANS